MELKPFVAACATCGQAATRALEVAVSLRTRRGDAVVRHQLCLCDNCAPLHVNTRLGCLPTHESTALIESASFPPIAGAWFKASDGGIVLGCPRCAQCVGLTNIHCVTPGGKLEPSFICPCCGFHCWLTLAEQT
jgi:hypothetical protein